jgi:hypothetical protein
MKNAPLESGRGIGKKQTGDKQHGKRNGKNKTISRGVLVESFPIKCGNEIHGTIHPRNQQKVSCAENFIDPDEKQGFHYFFPKTSTNAS